MAGFINIVETGLWRHGVQSADAPSFISFLIKPANYVKLGGNKAKYINAKPG